VTQPTQAPSADDQPHFEPLEGFDSFQEDVRKGIADLGWRTPMEVQRRVVPVVRAGRDLIAQAVTGSGKTGAFGLPAVELIDPEKRVVQLLVLAPTRELAIQIEKEVSIMGRHRGVRTIAVYGGTAYGPQLEAFEQGVHAVIGTPGRLLDHLESRRVDLKQVRMLIFDEADELLSLGFWPDMREIQKYLPKRRITGLFSATMPQRVMSLARVFLDDPVFVSLVKPGDSAPPEIEHYHYIVTAQSKDKELLRLLRYEDPDSAIIFCNTRADVRYLTAFLQRNHMDADMIQGEMTQSAREAVMRRIKAGELRFLVATDVAARGIDISDLSHVISYAAPESPEVYLHRTGRTGRAGKRGIAISLVSGLDIANFRYLQQVNRMEIPERPIPSDDQVAQRTQSRLEVDLDHELRELDERERRLRQEVHLPLVERLSQTPEGRRKLAAVLFQWLDHRHVPAPAAPGEEPRADVARPREAAAARERDDTPARDESEAAPAEGAPAKRRRRRRRRSRQASAD
jgi:ATP-dependent RNA helicase DeaD